MRYLRNTSTDPYFNMAFDEYCLERLPSGENFFFLWRNRPSVIIGLNQNAYSEVNLNYLKDNNITLARRVTGGGAVYHDLQNLNYTFVGENVSPAPFVKALTVLGLNAELTGRNDIFVDGRKVSGYARRVWHDREIVHGTMMYNVDLEELTRVLSTEGSKMEAKGIASVRSRVANLKPYLPQFSSIEEVQRALEDILSEGDGEYILPEEALSEIAREAESRFSSWEWVFGRSREADIERTAKLPCGSVTARISTDHGHIERVTFEGDFIGGNNANALEEILTGVRFDAASVRERLLSEDVGKYFDNTTTENIVTLFFNNKS